MGRIKLSDSIINTTTEEGKKLLSSIQGNILKSHGRSKSRHIFFQVKGPNEGRKWLSEFSKSTVTSGLEQQEQTKRWKNSNAENHEIFCNLMFSSSGYDALHINEHKKPGDSIFQDGMKYQDKVKIDLLEIFSIDVPIPFTNPLADPPVNKWEKPFQEDLHVLILLASSDHYEEELIKKTKNVIEEAAKNGLVHIHTEVGSVIRNEKHQVIEHFGHPDGVSQPLFLKCDYDQYLENQNISDKNEIAEYSDPKAELNLVLLKDPLGENEYDFGSYMVYRKLQQDVQGYNEKVKQLSDKLKIDVDLADKMVIGRDKRGYPMANYSKPKDGVIPDNFDFSTEPEGKLNVCPYQSHIRKSNPRTSESLFKIFKDGVPQQRNRRIARRAVSYGPHPDEHHKQGYQNDVGLLFLCANADIGLQFAFMQTIWLNLNRFQHSGTGQDTILGQSYGHKGSAIEQTWINHKEEEEKFLFNDVVNMKGGEYFFMPSMYALQNLDKPTK